MAERALFIGWGRPLPGREQQALQVFNESMEYWGRLQQQGMIERFEAFALGAHGGDLYGFALLRGEGDKLAQLSVSEEFQRHTLRADLVVDRVGIVPAVTGATLAQSYAVWQQQASELVR
jgi:hypothetical protein